MGFFMERKQVKRAIGAIDIVQIALMAAMAFVVTYLVEIPVGTKAVLHLGDTIVFTGAVLFGKKKAGIAAAIGMGMFDLLSPYAIWAPITVIAKGLMGFIAGAIAYRNGFNGDKTSNNIVGFVAAGIWMIFAYYIGGGLVYGNLIVPLGDIPGNILQVAAGIALALPLIKILKRNKVIRK